MKYLVRKDEEKRKLLEVYLIADETENFWVVDALKFDDVRVKPPKIIGKGANYEVQESLQEQKK
jgi:hypothetical protein